MKKRKKTSLLGTKVGLAVSSLAAAGAALAGDKGSEKVVTVESIPKPENPIVAQTKWSLVTIKLTDEQKAELQKLGVKTDDLRIQTADISRLSTKMNN